jgi:hypothetical protein
VDPTIVCQKVVQGVYAGVTTTQLDNLAAETAAYMSTTHPGAYWVGMAWWMKKSVALGVVILPITNASRF